MAHDLDWKNKRERRSLIKSYVRKFLLFPEFWMDSTKIISSALQWKSVLFEDKNLKNIPTKNGIYCFVVIPPNHNVLFDTGYLFYIGKATSTSLRTRFQNYLNEKKGIGIGDQKPRIKIEEMLNDFESFIYFFYSEIDDSSIAVDCENKLLDMFMPYVNTAIPEAQIKPEYKHIY